MSATRDRAIIDKVIEWADYTSDDSTLRLGDYYGAILDGIPDDPVGRTLNMEELMDMAESVAFRRSNFDEPLETSVAVVLANTGDHMTEVACVNGEWSGVKGDLTAGPGIPKCPNGHVMTESPERARLGWVKETIGL